MALTPTDAIVKKADSKPLDIALAEDQRHRLHAEAVTDRASASPYFTKWVSNYVTPTISSKSVREQFLRQIAFPLVSNEIVDAIMDAGSSVHYAQDRYIEVELTDDRLKADFWAFLQKRDLDGFFARNCHNALYNAPNSLIVIDLPAEQTTDFPEPYLYLLPVDKLKAAEPIAGHTNSGLLKFGFFETDDPKRRGLFDETDFSIWERIDARTNQWTRVLSVPHNLPFCPIFKMWADVDHGSPLVSNTPLRPLLGWFDRYVFWDGAREQSDLAAGFQHFWYLTSDDDKECTYVSEGFRCQGGVIEKYKTDEFGNNIKDSMYREDCPIASTCAKHKKKVEWGPGSTVPVPAQHATDDPDWRPAVGWVGAHVDNLEYIAKKVDQIGAKILRTATGFESGPQNREALNETQIMSILDKSRTVGQYLAEYFEIAHKRAIDGFGWLRYGTDYIGCTVNYGRRYVMLTGDQLMVLYQAAKEIGSLWLIEEIDGMLQDYYARADPSKKLRYQLLTDLNPYPYQTASELVAAKVHLTDPTGYLVSVGLMRWIKMFERDENISIQRFGVKTDYQKRVTEIYKAIEGYVKDQLDTNRSKNGSNPFESGSESGNEPAGPTGGGGTNANESGGAKPTGKRRNRGATA
jgi:hypothetical protein